MELSCMIQKGERWTEEYRTLFVERRLAWKPWKFRRR
ncbi:hypothetical protein LINPERHAP2_LOCUS5588 [Linum perenne]